MRTFQLDASAWLPAPLDQVFDFFSRPENLERLTPPFLNFRIVRVSTPSKAQRSTPYAQVTGGTLIDYRLSLHGIPISWRSEITAWDPPHRFVDEQRRGPYRLWRHTHSFEARDGGTLVGDSIVYAVWGGALVNRLFVGPDLRRIFGYRHRVLGEIFGGGSQS